MYKPQIGAEGLRIGGTPRHRRRRPHRRQAGNTAPLLPPPPSPPTSPGAPAAPPTSQLPRPQTQPPDLAGFHTHQRNPSTPANSATAVASSAVHAIPDAEADARGAMDNPYLGAAGPALRPRQRQNPRRRVRDRSPSPPQHPPPPAAPPQSADPRFRIAQSGIIPGGTGWGLYATEHIAGGVTLAPYKGEILREARLKARYRINDSGVAQRPMHYVLGLEDRLGEYFVDGRDPAQSNEMRYINHVPESDPRCTCIFTEEGLVQVKPNRRVAAGDELGISYGRAFGLQLRRQNRVKRPELSVRLAPPSPPHPGGAAAPHAHAHPCPDACPAAAAAVPPGHTTVAAHASASALAPASLSPARGAATGEAEGPQPDMERKYDEAPSAGARLDPQRHTAAGEAAPLLHGLPTTVTAATPSRHRITFWNANSLTIEKQEAVRELLVREAPLALIIVETRLTERSRFWAPNYFAHAFPASSAFAGGILIMVRNDIAGSDVKPTLSLGFNVPGAPAADKDTSTQWAAARIFLPNDPSPLVLAAVYIQPATHNRTVPVLRRQLAALAHEGTQPTIILGDFNYHAPSLGDDKANPPSVGAAGDVLACMQDHGFACLNQTLAYGVATHAGGGVLDLVFESAAAADAMVQDIRVNSAPDAPLTSDHHSITVELSVGWPNLPPALPREIWNTDTATPQQQACFTRTLDNVCASRPLGRAALHHVELVPLASALSALEVFSLGRAGVSPQNYRQHAQAAADAALMALETAVRTAASTTIGTRVKSPHETKGYAALSAQRRLARNATAAARTHPSNAALQETATATRLAYRQALQAVRKAQWDELCSAISESADASDLSPVQSAEPTAARNKLLWSKFKRVRQIRSRTLPLTTGLATSDGRLTSTVQDSLATLSDHYSRQLSEHPSVPSLAPEADPSIAVELRLLDAELAAPPPDCSCVGDLPPAARFTSEAAISALLAGSSLHTAMGPDGINGALLRLAAKAPTFCAALALLINFCYRFHVWPRGWRIDNKLPLLKKGKDPGTPDAYRPIAITSILARRVERLMLAQLEPIIEPQLSRWQHGFRKHRSTQQCVYHLQQRIHEAIRKPHAKTAAAPYPVVFLDISRAFDSVPHRLLLLKLRRAGVAGDLLRHYAAWLGGRQFRVIAHTAMGDWTDARAGVPQGCVQSPPLYALYINDMLPADSSAAAARITAFKTSAGYQLYADDSVIGAAYRDSRGRPLPLQARIATVQHQLDDIGAWAARWGVRFSANKSGCVIFRLSQKEDRRVATVAAATVPRFIIRYGSAADSPPPVHIPLVTQYQYLGVWLHECRSPEPQFQHTLTAATQAATLICSCLSRSSPPTATAVRHLTNALVLPRIAYALPFVNYTTKQLNRLTGTLLQPLLSVLSVPRTAHRLGACLYAGILPVAVYRDYAIARFTASNLALQHRASVRQCKAAFPIAETIWETFNEHAAFNFGRQMLQARGPSAPAALGHRVHKGYYTDAAANLRADLPAFDAQAHRIFQRWGLARLLPDYDFQAIAARPPKWDPHALAAAVRRAAGLQTVVHWLLETRGLRLHMRGFRYLQLNASKFGLRRSGEHLLPLLGFDPAPTAATGNWLSSTTVVHWPATYAAKPEKEWPLPLRGLGTAPHPSLRHDAPTPARLRARLTLNRADFLEVRHTRLAPDARLCQRCNAAEPETAVHVVARCALHEQQRHALRHKLSAFTARLQNTINNPLAAFTHLRPYRHLTSCLPQLDDNLLLTLCLGARPLAHALGSKLYAKLLRLTAPFLESIRLVRPV